MGTGENGKAMVSIFKGEYTIMENTGKQNNIIGEEQRVW